jgi:hypothetical protein
LVPDFEPLDLLDLEPPALVAIELLLRVAAIWVGGNLTISFLRPAGEIFLAGEPRFDRGVVAEAQS